MPTPVLDYLSADLARRLGDPNDENGDPIVGNMDGITYSATLRADYLTQAYRKIIQTLGHKYLQDNGYAVHLTKTFTIDSVNTAIDATVDRVLAVYFYDKFIEPFTLDRRGKRHRNIYRFNTFGWYINDGREIVIDGPWEKLNNATPVIQPTGYYIGLLVIETLTYDTGPDVVISPLFYAALLGIAEGIARRHHQELAQQLQAQAEQSLIQERDHNVTESNPPIVAVSD